MPTTAKGFVTPAGTPDDNDNLAAIQAIADRMDTILSARTAAAITALAGTDLWTGRMERQTDGTGSATRQQSGLYLYGGAAWAPGIGDGLGGTSGTPALTAATVNPNLGTSPTQEWDWWMIGPWCFAEIIIVWGSGSPTPGTGALRVGVPVAPATISGGYTAIGTGEIKDVSTGNSAEVVAIGLSATTCEMAAENITTRVTGNLPFVLGAVNDEIRLHLIYLT
jgi:hypothetical protein